MVTDSRYAFDAPPPTPRLRFLDPIDDDALSDLIAEDAQTLLRERRPVELSRYLNACATLPEHRVALDTAIEMTLQSMVQQNLGDLSACAAILSRRHPELADRIRIAAELSAAMNSTTLFRVISEFVGPLPLPSDFGPPMTDGVPRYQLLELLGRGSEGAVYRAVDRQMSDPARPAYVAVKMLAERSAGSHRRLARHDEAIRARRVNHPNVVRAIDRGVWDETSYAVFELVEGRRLDEFQGAARATPRQAAEIVREIAMGLQAIHSAGLIHCDLKPTNVLIDTRNTARIADFGLAQYLISPDRAETADPVQEASHGYGTLAFVAPEQFRRTPGCLAPPADIYALGGLLYWLLTGRTPNGATAEQARARLSAPTEAGDPELDFSGAAAPADLRAICARALRSDPAARYPSAANMAEDLQAFLHLRPLEWTRPALGHRLGLFARREPLKLLAALVALMAGIVSVSAITWSINQSRVVKLEADLETARQQARAREAETIANIEASKRREITNAIGEVKQKFFNEDVNYSEGWLPLVAVVEQLSGAAFQDNDTEDLVWNRRLRVVDQMLETTAARGGVESIEYLQYRTLKGVWCLQSGLTTDALRNLQGALDGYSTILNPSDPWLKYVRTLRDAAIACSIPAEQLRADPRAYLALRTDLENASVELSRDRNNEIGRALCLRAILWLTDPENGGHPGHYVRFWREAEQVRFAQPRPPTSLLP